MSIDLVRTIMRKIRMGKAPKWMLDLKEEGMNIQQLSEKIVSLINERKMAQSAAAGDEDMEFGDACWTEYAEAGEINGVWIRGMDTKTKIRNRMSGKLFSIDEIAHVAALDDWKREKGNIYGHIDHKKDENIDIGIEDVKYDFGEGLYFKLNPKDKKIRDGLEAGYIKPSIEIDFYSDMVDNDGKILKYRPSGIGLMVNGNARGGDNVGPGTPDPITSLSAEGGDYMPKEGDDENEGGAGDDNQDHKKDKPEDKKKPEDGQEDNPGDDENDEDENSDGGGDGDDTPPEDDVERLKKEIEEMKKERERLLKSDKIREDLENTIKKQLAAQIGEGYSWENRTLDEVKRDLELINTFSERFTKGVPSAGIDPIIPPSVPESDVNENGVPTKKWYKKVDEEFNKSRKLRKEIKR